MQDLCRVMAPRRSQILCELLCCYLAAIFALLNVCQHRKQDLDTCLLQESAQTAAQRSTCSQELTAFSWRHAQIFAAMRAHRLILLLLLAACCAAITSAEKPAVPAAPVLQQVVLVKDGPVSELNAAQSQLLAAGRFAHDQLQLKYYSV
jgi:hypothetical protein